MTTGHLCSTCNWLGTDCDTRSEREYDGLDSGPYRFTTYNVCPDCGSEDLSDVTLCESCLAVGVETEADDDDLCHECFLEQQICEAEHTHDLRTGR